MKLQKRMFDLIAEWHASELKKKDFLVGTNISQSKFDYWLKKYLSFSSGTNGAAFPAVQKDFTQIGLPQISVEIKLTKIILSD